VASNERMGMNGEKMRILNEVVVAYLDMISRHSPVQTKKNHKNLSQESL
jgi:hypothetical protein